MKTLRTPLQIDSRGGLATTISTADIIAQQIKDILMTNSFERVMNPTYGADLRSFVFHPARQQLMNVKADEVRSLLTRSVLLAKIIDVTISSSPQRESTLDVVVTYSISPSSTVLQLSTTITGLVTEETAFGDVL